MIRLDCPQGSRAWFDARLGLPTASNFHRIITPRKLTLSEQAVGYRNTIIAEWLLGETIDDGEFEFTGRGADLEAGARQYYEMAEGATVDQVGFLLHDDRICGGSPDGLVGSDGILELKCPSAAVHVGYLIDQAGNDKYRAQIQGNLWISGRQWCDFMSYHPTLPPVLVRVQRDDFFIHSLAAVVQAFCTELRLIKAQLLDRGIEPALVGIEPGFFAGVG